METASTRTQIDLRSILRRLWASRLLNLIFEAMASVNVTAPRSG